MNLFAAILVSIAVSAVTAEPGPSPQRGPAVDCPSRCRPTCKVPNPTDCETTIGCAYCSTGQVWHEERQTCVRIAECPYGKGCNGDPNASIRAKPPPCPSTCQNPDESYCNKTQLAVGCSCNLGYILVEEGGVCIKPNSCSGGHPCGANGTFTYCKIDCKTNFCPVDDSQELVKCNPGSACQSACICKYNYIWRSKENPTCILPVECPPIPCTRQNEVWDSCPPACFTDYCNAPDTPCYTLSLPNKRCFPQCRCKDGYARDDFSKICVLRSNCPVIVTPPPPPPHPFPFL